MDSTIWQIDPHFADGVAGDYTLLPESHCYDHAHDGEALGDLRWAVNDPLHYFFDVSVNGNGSVSIVPPPEGLTWDPGIVITLTALPDSGWAFQSWGGSIFGNQNPTSWPLNRDGFVVATFQQVSGREIPYRIEARRAGDIAACWADPSYAEQELNWRASLGLEEMCRDGWNWQQNNPEGYQS